MTIKLTKSKLATEIKASNYFYNFVHCLANAKAETVQDWLSFNIDEKQIEKLLTDELLHKNNSRFEALLFRHFGDVVEIV